MKNFNESRRLIFDEEKNRTYIFTNRVFTSYPYR